MKAFMDQLDVTILGDYLKDRIEGFRKLNAAKKFCDGQSNPTYLLSADSGQYVLRRKPSGILLKSAHAVDREFRVIKSLQDSSVPVARAYHLCTDDSIIGSMFYVMSYEQGRIFWNPALPESSKLERNQIYDEMNRVLAALHDVNIQKAGLYDFGRPGNYFARQVERWSKQYRASETKNNPVMEKLMAWLPANMPEDDNKVCLIHGDYRLDNLIFSASEGRVIAVLDWELSTLGHPYADLAYQCMQWRISNDSTIRGLGGIDCPAFGIPSEEDYVAKYCQRRGLPDIQHWNFYMSFSFFRLIAILQGIQKRAMDGIASSQKANEYGAFTQPLSDIAAKLIED